MMPFRFLEPATKEMCEAADWYERQTAGMGEAFLGQAQAAATFIAELPESGEKLPGGFRRKLLRQFPYALIYKIAREELVIQAVAHLIRRPGYWLRRDR
jgi:plasmid stabilization system protein ParE